jgi:AcrR family transcriptional regulator
LTVDRVVKRASRGRNTFYAHFRDVDQVLRAVESSVLSRVAAAVELRLADALNAEERLSALANGWLDVSDANPTSFRAMLLVGAPQGRVSSRARDLLRQELRRVLDDPRLAGVISAPLDELRLVAVGGAWDGVLRMYVEQRPTRESIVRILVDTTLRAFR